VIGGLYEKNNSFFRETGCRERKKRSFFPGMFFPAEAIKKGPRGVPGSLLVTEKNPC
jgi:hypothetical protein